ncbi:hypothetical protein TNCV_2298641 [Trichonephila clavipes]|nr:hypothetical protein TNCV_2298641 [Trichonephila clavipes]
MSHELLSDKTLQWRLSGGQSLQPTDSNRYGKEAPNNKRILRWNHHFEKTGCLRKKKSSNRPSVSEEAMERVKQIFVRSPRMPTKVAACELGMLQKTVWKILQKD